MNDNVYPTTEIVGIAGTSIGDAIGNAIAIATATKCLRHPDWFEVAETRGRIVAGKAAQYQVPPKPGFRYDLAA